MNFMFALIAVSILPYLVGLVRSLSSGLSVGIFGVTCLVSAMHGTRLMVWFEDRT